MGTSLTYADIAARKALADKPRVTDLLKSRKRHKNKLKLEAARREGTEIETAARMILRICDGRSAL